MVYLQRHLVRKRNGVVWMVMLEYCVSWYYLIKMIYY